MLHFIKNIGDYFASNYFNEDFAKKVIQTSGYDRESLKEFNKKISALKPHYFTLKQRFIENKLRVKDKVNLTHKFHTKVLEVLGYEAQNTDYDQLYPLDGKSVLPVRHILYRGDQPFLMIMEMHAMIKTSDNIPEEGLFEQQYSIEGDDEDRQVRAQKYHYSQWRDIYTVPENVSVSPMIIKDAVSELFHLPKHRRPKYILMFAGNQYFLLVSHTPKTALQLT